MSDTLNLYYARIANMGDLLNPLIIERCFGYRVERCSFLTGDLCAIGSGLAQYKLHGNPLMKLQQCINGRTHPHVDVWGSGFINYDDAQGRFFKRDMRFHAVRGELTRRRVERMTGRTLDIPTGDGGILASELLDTLPERELRCGAAEALKTAILFDPELFEHFRQRGLGFDRERVVAACVGHKRDVVCADERDNGRRQLLNLGHTIGHAVEACSGFSVLHGEAVAVGTCIMARLFARDADVICEAFAALGLPTDTDLPTEALALPMRSDKKRRGDALTLVVPHGVGDCTLETVPFEDFLNKLRKFRGK